MAISINSGDALAGAVTTLIAVDPANSEIVEVKAGRTLTVHPDVRRPNSSTSPSSTAPFGYSFRTLGGTNGNFTGAAADDNNTFRGVTFTPADSINLSGPMSLMIVWNSKNGSGTGGDGNATLTFGTNYLPDNQFQFLGTYLPHAIEPGSHSLLLVRDGGDQPNGLHVYLDGAEMADTSAGLQALGVFTAGYSTIGGGTGSGWCSLDRVFEVMFGGTALTSSDASRLHSSLTGGGAFALVTSSGAGDITIPQFGTGATIGISSITSTGYTITGPAATDNVAVTGYEYSLNGGTSYTDNGTALTVNITGRTPGTTDQVRWRAFDAAGNRSTPLSTTATLNSGTSATITTAFPLAWNTTTVQTNRSGFVVTVFLASTGMPLVTKTGISTNSSGHLAVSGTEMAAGTSYYLFGVHLASGDTFRTTALTAV